MESMTKNKKQEPEIRAIVLHAFPGMGITEIQELKEGYFNAAYRITLSNQQKVILKIAPRRDAQIMSYEKNIMFSEVTVMELVRKYTDLPVAKVFVYDSDCTLCDSPYFIMENLPGSSLAESGQALSEDIRKNIQYQIGSMTKQINSITGDKFGYPGQKNSQGNYWFSVFCGMMKLAVSDAEKMNVDLTIPVDKLFERLLADEAVFAEVTVPRLVHWDLWDGNIFVEQGKITGIIDFERAIWGDPLMEVGFRSYGQTREFLNGYGKMLSDIIPRRSAHGAPTVNTMAHGTSDFTADQQKRIRWYDIYLFLLLALEYDYRKYDTAETYEWATEMLRRYMRE